MWSISRVYLAGTEQAYDWCRRAAGPFFCIQSPPSAPLLAVNDVASLDLPLADFEIWKASASLIDAAAVRTAVPADVDYYPLPERDELLKLKWMASETRTQVAHYTCEKFAGYTEYEFAWEFGPVERVLIHLEGECVCEVSAPGTVNRRPGQLLSHMLNDFGINSDGYFAPHRRDFDWDRHRST